MTTTENNSPRVLFMVPGTEYMAYQDRILREQRGCEIDIVQRGDIALDLTSRFRYDLIFAYIAGMPPGSDSALSKVYCGGLARLPDHVPTGDTFGVLCACIKRIKKEGKNRDTPILAHSFYDQPDDDRILSAGIDEWIGRLDANKVVPLFDRYTLK